METPRTLSPIPKTEGIQGDGTQELLQEFGKHELNIEDAVLDSVVLPRLGQMADEERTTLLRTIGVEPEAVQVSWDNDVPSISMSNQTRSFVRSGIRLRFRDWFLPSTFPMILEKTAPVGNLPPPIIFGPDGRPLIPD